MQTSLELWKLNRMTILVGMVGSDGILLAADQRQTRLGRSEERFDDHADICKITHLERHKVAYARVGDEVSKLVGIGVAKALDTEDFYQNIGMSLEEIACQTIAAEKQRQTDKNPFNEDMERSLLVVFYGDQVPEPQLWRLRISPPHPSYERITGITVAGAVGNRARFFDRYFRCAPINSLVTLASHIVLAAGRIDPVMIRGLDVALFSNQNCRFLNAQERQTVQMQSEELDDLIRQKLLPPPK